MAESLLTSMMQAVIKSEQAESVIKCENSKLKSDQFKVFALAHIEISSAARLSNSVSKGIVVESAGVLMDSI